MTTKCTLCRTVFFMLSFYSITAIGQAPPGFNYQAVARQNNILLSNTTLDVEVTLHRETPDGPAIYSEMHQSETNDFGLFSIIIGDGVPVLGAFSDVDWEFGNWYLSIKVKPDGGGDFVSAGAVKLQSVPYALFAESTPDQDSDPANEIQDLQLNGNTLSITKNPDAAGIDLAAFQGTNTDNQTLSIENGQLVITGGNSVDLQAYTENAVGWNRDGDNVVYMSGNIGVGTVVPEGRFTVQGVNEGEEEPLFMVTRKDGYPVFAVYEHGVYAYTDTAESGKGIKGGFTVGGYKKATKGMGEEYMRVTADSIRFYIHEDPDGQKGLKGGFAVGGYQHTGKNPLAGSEYLRVTPDSVRIYIDDDPASKGLKGGFAVGGYKEQSKGDVEYFNISGLSSAELIPGENRVVWYPERNAFMVGNVFVEDPQSVGINSFAAGYRTQAMGDYSEAFGYLSRAEGNNSTAIGNNAVATGSSSFALGSGAKALGQGSYAFGSEGFTNAEIPVPSGTFTTAQGDHSFAFGLGTISSSNGAFSFGTSSTASGIYSLSMGFHSSATAPHAVVIGKMNAGNGAESFTAGYRATSNGLGSIAIGSEVTAEENYAVALGSNGTAGGVNSISIGNNTSANASSSAAIGWGAESGGFGAVSLGYNSFANGDYSLCAGPVSFAQGANSVALGTRLTAASFNEIVVGQYNESLTPLSATTWNAADPHFIIGNGTSEGSRSNSMVVYKNGNVEISGSLATKSIFGNYINAYMLNDHNNGNVSLSSLGLNMHLGYQNTRELLFYTGTGTGVGTVKMKISQNGNIGIGTGNPSTTLDVNGTAKFEGNIAVGTSVSQARIHAVSTNVNVGTIRGESTYSGTSVHYGGAFVATTGTNGTGVYAAGSNADFFAGGPGTNYAPFTGSHQVILTSSITKSLKPGMIVSMTGRVEKRVTPQGDISISSTLPEIELSTRDNDKAVLGVFVSEQQNTGDHWAGRNVRLGMVNALGEGRVWVCNRNGDIEAGDYITTSEIPGYGQKQADDLLHNYTLGKATETIDWDNITDTIEIDGRSYKIYLLGIIYTSG